nr:hypothetical protein B0A51_11898 [Rachicladosporium sp. CCFEE 5018]
MDTGHSNIEGRGPAVLAVSSIILAVATLFVIFRMISRGAIVKRISPDDYLMLVAWLLTFGMTFAVCWGTRYGLGRHEEDVPDAWQSTLKKADYAFSVLYNPALMATKTSILMFYLTLSQTNRTFRWATIATLVVVNAGGLALTFLNIFQCRPVGAVFATPLPDNAKCTDIVIIYLTSAPLNIITDLAILFLPMPILTGMRLPKKQKIILIITFSFGIFVAAVDVVRIAYLQEASQTRLAEIQSESGGSGSSTQDTDFSWYASLSFMWSVLEVNVGVCCACVPALKPLVSRFMPQMLRDRGDVTEKSGTFSLRDQTADMANAHRIPSVISLPDGVDANAHTHACPPREQAEDDGSMGMMDFLTTPDMSEFPSRLDRTQTALTNTTRHTAPDSPAFFDFVNMQGKKSMLHMTNRESVFPISMVTILFFIWGFEYGLLDVLNQQFQRVSHMTAGQTTSIHSAYFIGYFLGPWLIGNWTLHHWGFKACYSVGLSIYACGTLIFWPSAVLTSYPAYLITNIIVGIGLSVLETSANPFIALCGPPEYAEIRLNLSQGVQAIGTVVAPLIANRAFFRENLNAPSLVSTQYAYLGIALFTIALAVAYHYVPLPEATQEELEDAAERLDSAHKASIGRVPVIWIILSLAALSQFCYVGAQEVVGTTFSGYMAEVVSPDWNEANFNAIGHTLFALSRFIAAGLNLFIKPRYLLLAFYIGTILFSTLAMHLPGKTGLTMIILTYFFEGPLFALIFAQGLRGMGRHTKFASVVITSAISGGAVFSPISNYLALDGKGAQYALIVAAVVFGFGTLMPIGLCASPALARVVDPVSSKDASERPSETSSRASRALSFLNIGKKEQGEGEASGSVEFRERKASA